MTGLDPLIISLALAAAVILLAPLLRGREEEYSLEPPRSDEDASGLAARRGAALEALRDLDFEHSTGKISGEDHARLRAVHVAEAAAALREIEESRSKDWAALESQIQARKRELGKKKDEKRK